MDINLDKDGSVIGSLFQQIIGDMKNTSPIWEDFVVKATKLHMCLRAAIQAIAVYLDAFQKIADAATNSKGASKEIGTALTRVCLRHKAVETRMKTFTSAIMDFLIIPLQEKLEDWRKQVAMLDKEHTKEYKRCRTELKKRSSDTLRLQKKARKGQSEMIQNLVDSSMQDVTLRRAELEEVEKKSLRAAMIEDRARYCCFVNMLQPVVKEECEVMSELEHLEEAMQSIALVTKDPNILPQVSEELILESRISISLYPESPGGSNSQGCSNSLGSRKSSVCSISSMNSSGSSGSPGHQYQRSLSQLMAPIIRLKPGESSDSGFCSSPALTSQASTATNQAHAVSTWPPHTQDVASSSDRPHTISSAYEKGHQRPALTVYTFQSPDISESQKSPANVLCRPPLPIRCSSLERPVSSAGSRNIPSSIPRQCPSPIPAHITKEHPQLQPTYVNMSELASMAALKITNNQQQLHQQLQQHILNSPVSIASSLISSDSSATNQQSSPDLSISTEIQTPQNNSPNTNNSPQITPVTGTGDGSGNGSYCEDNSFLLHQQEQTQDDNNEKLIFSPDNDVKCKGSVLEKTSMFEKLELLTSTNNNNNNTSVSIIPRSESIYSKRNEEIYKSAGMLERDADQYQDSLEELNNLIGELDSFQREHEKKSSGLDNDSNDKLSLQGYNYSTESSESNRNCSGLDSNNLSTEELNMGYENPSFVHKSNDNNEDFNTNTYNFNRENSESEIVILRCKENYPKHKEHNFNNNEIEKHESLQRFSSFRAREQRKNIGLNYIDTSGSGIEDKHNVSKLNLRNVEKVIKTNTDYQINREDQIRLKPVVSPRPASLSGCVTRITRRSSVNSMKPPPPVRRSSSVTPSHNAVSQKSPSLSQQNLMNSSSESLPPPPAYLLDTAGNTSPGNVAETVKALTEIRHMPASPSVLRRVQNQINQVSPIQQNAQYTNTLSSPPKHESNVTSMYIPHSATANSSNIDSHNMPYKSPNTSQIGIYAQPKVSKMSSFRTQNSGVPKQNSGLISQLNSRLPPAKQQQHQQQIYSHQNQIYSEARNNQNYESPIVPSRQINQQQQLIYDQHGVATQPTIEQIYSRTANDIKQYSQKPCERTSTNYQQANIFLPPQQNDGYSTNFDKSGSVLTKTSVGFLENLNAKLTEQRLSGKAFAVRNLINSKALQNSDPFINFSVKEQPDPRICHESLMDQIKRGATLKRNRTVNDRSAPKMH